MPKNILIVEDDNSIREVFAEFFKILGHNCIEKKSGNEAIKFLASNRDVDVIVTDFSMPDGDGFDLVEYATKNRIDAPVIMMTAFGTKDIAVRSINLHVFSFIEKLVPLKVLEKAINDALAKRKLDQDVKRFANIGQQTQKFIEVIDSSLVNLDKEIVKLKEISNNATNPYLKELVTKIEVCSNRVKESIKKDPPASSPIRKLIIGSSLLKELEVRVVERSNNKNVAVVFKKTLANFYGDKDQILNLLDTLIHNCVKLIAPLDIRWVSIEIRQYGEKVQIVISDSFGVMGKTDASATKKAEHLLNRICSFNSIIDQNFKDFFILKDGDQTQILINV